RRSALEVQQTPLAASPRQPAKARVLAASAATEPAEALAEQQQPRQLLWPQAASERGVPWLSKSVAREVRPLLHLCDAQGERVNLRRAGRQAGSSRECLAKRAP